MKKFVVLSSITFLILAFGATVYGQEKAPVLEFKASGFIDVITEYLKNVPNPGLATSAGGGTWFTDTVFNPAAANVWRTYAPTYHYMLPGGATGTYDEAFNHKMAYVENRGRLKFDAIMGKEMSGTFFFEFDSLRWGERAPSGAQRQYSGHWGVADRSSLELKNMFFTFGMPWIPIPTTIQAGIQPVVIRPGFFLATDGPAITAAFKIDPAMIKLIWAKAGENRDYESDDSDLYAIEANMRIQTMTVGAYGVYFNMNTYPIADVSAYATLNGPSSSNFTSSVWWLGLYADGKMGPLNLNFDAIYDFGKNQDHRDYTQRQRDVDFRGYGLRLNVSYPWEKFLFGAATIYGSGADMKKTSASALPGSTVANIAKGGNVTSSKVGTYIVPAGTEGGVGDSLILTGSGVNRMNTGWEYAGATAHAAAPIGGLWINKVYAGLQVSPIFNTRLEAMYVLDTTKNGNTIGTAIKPGTIQQRDDDVIGWEFDWFNTLSIYKNLTWQVGFGYLFAGKAMDFYNLSWNQNKSTQNPWVLTTNLTYSF